MVAVAEPRGACADTAKTVFRDIIGLYPTDDKPGDHCEERRERGGERLSSWTWPRGARIAQADEEIYRAYGLYEETRRVERR